MKVARTVRSGGKRPETGNAVGVCYLSLFPGTTKFDGDPGCGAADPEAATRFFHGPDPG